MPDDPEDVPDDPDTMPDDPDTVPDDPDSVFDDADALLRHEFVPSTLRNLDLPSAMHPHIGVTSRQPRSG